MNKTGEPRSSSKRGKLPPLKTSTTQAYKKLRNIKDENYSGSIEVKNWMKSMVEMSLKLGNDLSYIKGVMLKNREKEKLEKNLLKIRKNIKIVKLRGRPRRRGLTNSFLKRSSMQRLGQHNYSEFSNGQSHKYGQLRQNQSIEDIYSRMNHSNIISNRNSAFKRYQRSELTENNNNFSIQGKFLLSDQDFSKEGSEMNNEGEGKKEPIDTLIEMIDQAKELKSKIRNDLIKKEIPQHEKFKRLRRLLRQKLIELGKMGLSLEEYQKHEIFPKKPFLRPGSYELIEAAKMDDLDTLKKILADNPYLVYDYDHVSPQNSKKFQNLNFCCFFIFSIFLLFLDWFDRDALGLQKEQQ